MNIDVSRQDGETVVKVAGCLDTAAAAEFQRAADGIPAETKQVTFDFTDVEFIASSALRVMVTLGKRLNAADGSMAVVGANEVVRDVFEMTGLSEVFALR